MEKQDKNNGNGKSNLWISIIKDLWKYLLCIISWDMIKQILEYGAKAAIIVGVVIGIFGGIITYKGITQTEHIDRKNIAINAISKIYNSDFIKARTRFISLINSFKVKNMKNIKCNNDDILREIYNEHDIGKCRHLLIYDVNYILLIYDYLASLYFNEIADKEIIRSSIFIEIREFKKGLENISKELNINILKMEPSYVCRMIKEDRKEEKKAREYYQPQYKLLLIELDL